MGLTPFLAFAFQGNPIGRTVVDPDPELLSGVRSIFVFIKAPVLDIIEIQTADAVAALRARVAVQRDQTGDPILQHPHLRICDLIL